MPGDLDESALTPALRSGWKLNVVSMSYLPIGWGSHHWDVHDRDGMRWFVTVDPAATGITPLPELTELYRLGWNVKDTAADAARFFRPHSDSADDVKTWKLLNLLVNGAGG